MPHFYTGDELGTLKLVSYEQVPEALGWKAEVTSVHEGGDKSRAVQKLALHKTESRTLLAAARADGSVSVCKADAAGLEDLQEWKEPRLKAGQRFVGLGLNTDRVYSCTSNGALRLVHLGETLSPEREDTTALPMRLCNWRLSPNAETFAYGGEEVELSLWSAEQAFSAPSSAELDSKKRKRGDQLLPGELWRAKNVANDNLSLRQPVHVTSLTYLKNSSSSSHHLAIGTQFGGVRRYDTRAARRPVGDWKDICKSGAISHIDAGLAEHELLVADSRSNLSAVDLRNGKRLYSYKGLAGAVTSFAPASGEVLASVSQDRFLRLHSTHPPPAEAGHNLVTKGEVLDKIYMKVTPTVVVWDQNAHVPAAIAAQQDDEGGADDVWAAMEDVESGDEGAKQRRGKKSRHTSSLKQ